MEPPKSELSSMTLGRALRYKKRVVEAIRNLEMDIQTNNSVVEGQERDVEIESALVERSQLVKHLVELKMVTQNATRPIQRLVLQIAEAKAEITFLQRIDVTHGTARAHFGQEAVKLEAALRKPKRDEMVRSLQRRIDQLQAEIDAFNAATSISIEVPESLRS